MSHFERLQSQIEDGAVRMIHIEAVPRSIATALSRALNESGAPSVFINEPFHSMRHDIEAASEHVLDVVDASPKPTDEPLVVIVKNLSRNLTLPLYEKWIKICGGLVWGVRHPLIQMGSLITRMANDLEYEPGVDRLTQQQLTSAQITAVSVALEAKGFSKTSWADMGKHFRSGIRPERSVAIDGGELVCRPHIVLAHAAHTLGLPFDARMVRDWQKGFTRTNPGHNPRLDDATRAWTKDAVTSTGIMPVSRPALDPSELPRALQQHIVQVAMPVYQEIVASDALK